MGSGGFEKMKKFFKKISDFIIFSIDIDEDVILRILFYLAALVPVSTCILAIEVLRHILSK